MIDPVIINSTSRQHGAVSQQALKAIGLVVVIVACLGFILSFIFGGDPTPERILEFGFQCSECEHHWTMSNDEAQQTKMDQEALKEHRGRRRNQPHCPKCKERHTGLSMLKCPECGEFFLHSMKQVRSGKGESSDPICPHCNTNLHDWHRENR